MGKAKRSEPKVDEGSLDRIAKLEKAVKAGLRLRRLIEDLTGKVKGPMLSVPRAAVEQYDLLIESLKEKE